MKRTEFLKSLLAVPFIAKALSSPAPREGLIPSSEYHRHVPEYKNIAVRGSGDTRVYESDTSARLSRVTSWSEI